MTSRGLLLWTLVEEEPDAVCSRSRCLAFAVVYMLNTGYRQSLAPQNELRTFQTVDLKSLDLFWSQVKIRRTSTRWGSRRPSTRADLKFSHAESSVLSLGSAEEEVPVRFGKRPV